MNPASSSRIARLGTAKNRVEAKLQAARERAAAKQSQDIPEQRAKESSPDAASKAATTVLPAEPALETKPQSFSDLGINAPISRALSHLAITIPTDIQALTIPAILAGGRDVVGGAQTGSGKTLCFALPILQRLASDPVAGFALVLTPTRELAMQLHQQFVAVAQGIRPPLGLHSALVVGGLDQLKQASTLSNVRPHVIIATPGRLVDILQSSGSGCDGLLSRCRFVVLDEADLLLTPSFAPELAYLFQEALPSPKQRQTLLFTATLTESIDLLVARNAGRAKEEGKQAPLVCKIGQTTSTPKELIQRYILVPSHMREPHLYHMLRHSPALRQVVRRPKERSSERSTSHPNLEHGDPTLNLSASDADSNLESDSHKEGVNQENDKQAKNEGGKRNEEEEEDEDEIEDDAEEEEEEEEHEILPHEEEGESEDEEAMQKKLKRTPTIIFVNRSSTADQISRMLTHLDIPNVALHSLLDQRQRLDNLQTFRAAKVPVLVSTDVGSRGLDIPQVQCVINFDLPAAWEDYVHRVGRTARYGKTGWAVSFVTEHDVRLVQSIEEKIGKRLSELKGFTDRPGGSGFTLHKTGEEKVMEHLSRVMAAKRTARLDMDDAKMGERQERNKRKNEMRAGAGQKKQKKHKSKA